MRRAFYGGAFDPFHVGHLHVVMTVALHGLPVLVAPTYRHPYGKKTESFADRLAMTALGIASVNTAEVCDIEKDNESGTTVEVLRLLKSRYPDDEFTLVIGETEALMIEDWIGGNELIRKQQFMVIPRRPAVAPDNAWYKLTPNIYLQNLQRVDASSTTFKKTLENDSVAAMGMLDPFVSSYIIGNDLYNTENPDRR